MGALSGLAPMRQVPVEARRPTRSLILPVPLPVTLPVFPPVVLVGVLAVPLLPVSSFSLPPGVLLLLLQVLRAAATCWEVVFSSSPLFYPAVLPCEATLGGYPVRLPCCATLQGYPERLL